MPWAESVKHHEALKAFGRRWFLSEGWFPYTGRRIHGDERYMGVSKNSGFSPQRIRFNRVFHYFHHPFWGTLIFGNTHMNPT